MGEREVEIEEGEVDEKEKDEESKRTVIGTPSGRIIAITTNLQNTVDQPTILPPSRHVTDLTNSRVVSVPGHPDSQNITIQLPEDNLTAVHIDNSHLSKVDQ